MTFPRMKQETPESDLLSLDPNYVISFPGASEGDVITDLTLRNVDDSHTVLYKVKCTDNKKFMIPECAGLIKAGCSVVLNIKRYDFNTAPKDKEKVDKFCIEHLISPTSNGDPKILWMQATAQDVRPRIQKLEVGYDDTAESKSHTTV